MNGTTDATAKWHLIIALLLVVAMIAVGSSYV